MIYNYTAIVEFQRFPWYGELWQDGNSTDEEILSSILRNCYKNALELAKEQSFDTIAFPLISSGSHGCPKDVALNIAVRSIGEFLLFNEMTVYLVVYDKKSYQLSEALFTPVETYIDDHYIDDHMLLIRNQVAELVESNLYEDKLFESSSFERLKQAKTKKKSLEDVVKHLEETFSEMLLRMIDEKGLKDPEVYKKANVTKQTFSKIRNNMHYNPTKQTVLAFAIALQLNIDEAKDLLLKSGYALSKSSRFDVIISYFFESENYDIYEINAVLFEYDENLLGIEKQ